MRINIDDSLFADFRFRALVRHLGDEWRAMGMCIDFWRAAAHHWGHEGRLVPKSQFLNMGFEPLLQVGLAEEREGGIYAKGTIDHLDWYRKKREDASKAGKASAASRLLKFGSAQPPPEQTPNGRSGVVRTAVRESFEHRSNTDRTASNPPAPVPALALSPTHSPPPNARARSMELMNLSMNGGGGGGRWDSPEFLKAIDWFNSFDIHLDPEIARSTLKDFATTEEVMRSMVAYIDEMGSPMARKAVKQSPAGLFVSRVKSHFYASSGQPDIWPWELGVEVADNG